VVDLYADGNKSEAPKLTKGHQIIGEFGCFGCHEINGYKGGRQIGPDMRLEPGTPLGVSITVRTGQAAGRPGQPAGHLSQGGSELVSRQRKDTTRPGPSSG